MSFRENPRTEGVRSLITHRVFVPYDHAHNARIEDGRYNQRSVCETVNSVIKRSSSSTLRARAWYRQFREIALAAAVYNVERAVKQYIPTPSPDSL
jgi:IS5 family transposase